MKKKPINHDGQHIFQETPLGGSKKPGCSPPTVGLQLVKESQETWLKETQIPDLEVSRRTTTTWGKLQSENGDEIYDIKPMTKMEAQRYWPQLWMFELWIWCRFIGRFLGKKISCALLSSSFCTWSSSKGRRNVKSGSQEGDACSGLAAFGPRVTTVVPCSYSTLHGTNISHLMTFLSRWFSFSPRWDMDLFGGGYIKNTNVLLGHHSQHASVWTAALVPCWNLTQLTKKPGSLVSMDQRSLKSFLSKENLILLVSVDTSMYDCCDIS